jgi:hypothetical protein
MTYTCVILSKAKDLCDAGGILPSAQSDTE